jgi:predicted ATPases of PP-loop superfamily
MRRSTMHGIPTALLQMQAESIGIPLYIVDLTPKGNMEDYGDAMFRTVEHFGTQGVAHFIFGAIFLHDVRKYREKQLTLHGNRSRRTAWEKSSEEVMNDFLTSELRCVVITTMTDGLGSDAIGREIDHGFIVSLPVGVDLMEKTANIIHSVTTARFSGSSCHSGSADPFHKAMTSTLTMEL